MTTTVASLQAVLSADTRQFTNGLREAERGLSGFASRAGERMQRVGRQMTTHITLPLAAIGTGAVMAAVSWESAFAGVLKTVDGTEEQLGALENQLREMATSPDSLVSGLENAQLQLAQIAEMGGQLGVPIEMLGQFTEVVAELTMSTDLSAESAAMMAAQFANITGMDFSNMDEFGATIVALGNNLATAESTVLEFAQRMAGAASVAGMTEQNILGLSAAMASVGLAPEAGASAMTQVINRITEAVAEGGSALQTFAEITGWTSDQFAQSWRNEPIAALMDFIDALGGMSAEEQVAVLDELGLSGLRVSDTLRRLAGAEGLLDDAISLANDAWDENTALTDEAQRRADTAESTFNRLKNQLFNVGITIGNKLLPHVVTLAEKIGEWLTSLEEIDPALLDIVVGLGLVALAAGPVIGLVGTVASVIGAIGFPALLAGAALLALALASGQLENILPLLGDGLVELGTSLGSFAGGDAEAGLDHLRNGLAKLVEAGGLLTGGIADRVIEAIESLTGLDLPSAGEALQIGADILQNAFKAVDLILQNGAFIIENAFDAIRLRVLEVIAGLRDDILEASGFLHIDIAPDINVQLAEARAEAVGPALGNVIVDTAQRYLDGEYLEVLVPPTAEFSVDVGGAQMIFSGMPEVAPSNASLIEDALRQALLTQDMGMIKYLLPVVPELDIDMDALAVQIYTELVMAGDTVAAMQFRQFVDPLIETDMLDVAMQLQDEIRAAAESRTFTATASIQLRANVDASQLSIALNNAVSQRANIGVHRTAGGGYALGMGGGYRLPSFAGGGFMSNDGLAFLHAGEVVLTPEQQRQAAGRRIVVENLHVYGQSPYELLDMLERAARNAAP